MRQRHHPAAGVDWLDVKLDSVEEQLALDEALLEEAHEGETTATVVRAWMACEPVVVVGSSSRVEEEVDLVACLEAGIRVVRRPSGGLTVVLGPGCLMWSVVEPHPEGAPPIERIHARMLDPLAHALSEALSLPGGVARRGSSDLVVGSVGGGRKISGNALRVRRHGVLYHGTLLDDFDIGLVDRILRHPPREPDYRARRPHREFLANLGLGPQGFEAALRRAFGATRVRTSWPADRVARLVAERYTVPAWTNRL